MESVRWLAAKQVKLPGTDNETHHRAQAYVYLRALGIEPPAFWDSK
ncbi:MAG: DinB family protein [Daejeonella sp.]